MLYEVITETVFAAYDNYSIRDTLEVIAETAFAAYDNYSIRDTLSLWGSLVAARKVVAGTACYNLNADGALKSHHGIIIVRCFFLGNYEALDTEKRGNCYILLQSDRIRLCSFLIEDLSHATSFWAVIRRQARKSEGVDTVFFMLVSSFVKGIYLLLYKKRQKSCCLRWFIIEFRISASALTLAR